MPFTWIAEELFYMIRAVVFDLDDTLISEKNYIFSGFRAISQIISRDFAIDEKEVLAKMDGLFCNSPKNVFNRLLDSYNIQYNSNYIIRLITAYREHSPKIEVYKDVIPVLTELRRRQIFLGIITDGYRETQRKKLESLSFYYLFDSIIITDELGREFWKPHELSYQKSSEELNTAFKDMIYVGDNVSKDFITANKLGISTIQIVRDEGIYKNLKAPKDFKAGRKIYDLKDLLDNV